MLEELFVIVTIVLLFRLLFNLTRFICAVCLRWRNIGQMTGSWLIEKLWMVIVWLCHICGRSESLCLCLLYRHWKSVLSLTRRRRAEITSNVGGLSPMLVFIRWVSLIVLIELEFGSTSLSRRTLVFLNYQVLWTGWLSVIHRVRVRRYAWYSIIILGTAIIGASIIATILDAKPIHVVASDVIVDLFLHGLLALDALRNHLAVLFHGYWFSHLYTKKRTMMSISWFSKTLYYLLLRTLFLLCLRSCLFEVQRNLPLFSLGSVAPSFVFPIFFRCFSMRNLIQDVFNHLISKLTSIY